MTVYHVEDTMRDVWKEVPEPTDPIMAASNSVDLTDMEINLDTEPQLPFDDRDDDMDLYDMNDFEKSFSSSEVQDCE